MNFPLLARHKNFENAVLCAFFLLVVVIVVRLELQNANTLAVITGFSSLFV